MARSDEILQRDQSAVRPDAPIIASGLRKSYRERPAVDGIDLTVLSGEIYGFLGPNGAGKTTTMRMLLGLVRPDGGKIRLFGRDLAVEPLRARAGVAGIVEEPRLYTYLSGRRNLKLLRSYDRSDVEPDAVEHALELVELSDRGDDRVSTYSQGMRQRLGIAACLVRRPRLLMLDEPANGLDPAGIRFLRTLLRRLAAEGVTVFLSSHLLAEVQELCHRVAIVTDGRIVYEGSVEELLARAGRRYRLRTLDPAGAWATLRDVPGVSDPMVVGDELEFGVAEDQTLALLGRRFADEGITVLALVPEQLTLEHVFFELTERTNRATAGSVRR